MTSLGSLLWIVGIGAFIYFFMRNDGRCCGGGPDESHGSNKKELGHNQGDD